MASDCSSRLRKSWARDHLAVFGAGILEACDLSLELVETVLVVGTLVGELSLEPLPLVGPKGL